MLKSLRVQNFKSLVDFKIDFEPFTVLIGKNGSGKTTVLQALELLSAFIHGNVNHFLDKQEWKASDLFSSFSEEKEMKLELLYSGKYEKVATNFSWKVSFLLDEFGLFLNTEELLVLLPGSNSIKPSHSLYSLDYRKHNLLGLPQRTTSTIPSIESRLKQSTLSLFLRSNGISSNFKAPIFEAPINIFLLDVQDSKALRADSEKTERNVSRNGKDFAGFLTSFSVQEMKQLNVNLKNLIPQAFEIATEKSSRDKFQLVFTENYPTKQKDLEKIRVWPEHISDGTLRIIALLVTIQGAKPGTTILLDEIENGIDPTQMGLLVQMMDEQIKKKGIQVILSTHSPVALNYVPEEGIRYFKREPDGNVTATNIFENGELKKMLEYMNAGEIWLNLEEKELLGGE